MTIHNNNELQITTNVASIFNKQIIQPCLNKPDHKYIAIISDFISDHLDMINELTEIIQVSLEENYEHPNYGKLLDLFYQIQNNLHINRKVTNADTAVNNNNCHIINTDKHFKNKIFLSINEIQDELSNHPKVLEALNNLLSSGISCIPANAQGRNGIKHEKIGKKDVYKIVMSCGERVILQKYVDNNKDILFKATQIVDHDLATKATSTTALPELHVDDIFAITIDHSLACDSSELLGE